MCSACVSFRHRWENMRTVHKLDSVHLKINSYLCFLFKVLLVAVISYSINTENVVSLGTTLCREALFRAHAYPLFLLEAMMEV